MVTEKTRVSSNSNSSTPALTKNTPTSSAIEPLPGCAPAAAVATPRPVMAVLRAVLCANRGRVSQTISSPAQTRTAAQGRLGAAGVGEVEERQQGGSHRAGAQYTACACRDVELLALRTSGTVLPFVE